MAAKMAVAGVRQRWRRCVLVAVSVPVLGAPFLPVVKAGSMRVHPRELEIYDPVEQSKEIAKPSEEDVSEFEKKVSEARKFVWGWTGGIKEGLSKVRFHYSLAEAKTLEFVDLIQTDAEFQMKVGGITAAVLGGAVLAGGGRRPIRRILYSAVLGTTAAAICYPKQAVEIALADYDRLKVFIKEQLNTFNQRRAEQPVIKELESPVRETVISEDQVKPTEERAEVTSVDQNENQVQGGEEEIKPTQPELAVEEKSTSSFWSKIPFLDKIMGIKEPVSSSDVTPVAPSKEESATAAVEAKDQVIVQEESTVQAKVEGDIGQSNPEDKDMYSTRS